MTRPAESSSVSIEFAAKKRFSLRAGSDSGLMPSSAALTYASNARGVQTWTHRSIPFERTTPSASEARNLAGIVSRFLASRVWSKVPRKAICHRACPASRGTTAGGRGARLRRRDWTRTEVEEWEEPLHPGPHVALVPHYPPLSNSTCTSSPTSVVHLTPEGPKSPCRRAIAGWEAVGWDRSRERNARCGSARCTSDCRSGAVPSDGCALEVGRGGPVRGYDGPTMPPRSR